MGLPIGWQCEDSVEDQENMENKWKTEEIKRWNQDRLQRNGLSQQNQQSHWIRQIRIKYWQKLGNQRELKKIG